MKALLRNNSYLVFHDWIWRVLPVQTALTFNLHQKESKQIKLKISERFWPSGMMPANTCCFCFRLDSLSQAQSTRPPVPGDELESPRLKLRRLPHCHKTSTQRCTGSGFLSVSHVCSAFVVSSDCKLVCLQASWRVCSLSDCHHYGEELLVPAICLFSS